jgi:hypothetical protein
MKSCVSPRASALRRFYFLFLMGISALLPAGARAQAAWTQTHRSGDEVRFLFTGSVYRYDVSAKSWLSTITLPRTGATAITGNGTANYVSYGASIYRYDASFGAESTVGAASTAVKNLFVDGNLLFAVHDVSSYTKVTTFNRVSGSQLYTGAVSNINWLMGFSHAPGLNKFYSRTGGISPADIYTVAYNDSGTVTGYYDSNYHGDYPGANRTFVSPDERQVTDTSGTVYNSSMLYLGSLGGALDSVSWNGDVPIVLRSGTQLIAYRNNRVEAGRVALPSAGAEVVATATDAIVFSTGNPQPSARVVPLTSLNAPAPGAAIDPNGLAYTADDVFVDRDGVVNLLSRNFMSLFRWSTTQHVYLPTVPLLGAPLHITYSSVNHTVYTEYSDLTLKKMDLSAASPVETPFATIPEGLRGLIATADFIYAVGLNGWIPFKPDGSRVPHNFTLYSTSVTNTWDSARRRMYHFRDGTSPGDLMYHEFSAAGPPIAVAESQQSGSISYTPPIRVKPDGNHILIGSGVVFKADDLYRLTSISNAVADGLWSGASLVTLRSSGSSTQLQTWNGTSYTAGSITRTFTGSPLRLFTPAAGMLVITSVDGAPRFTLLDTSYNTVFASPTKPAAPGTPTLVSRTFDSLTVRWTDLSNNEDGFRVEYRLSGGTGAWLSGADTGAGITSAHVSGLTPRTAYDLRVLATNGSLVSAASSTLTVTTSPSPDEPVGEPYNLTAARIFNTSVTLTWTDNASNETGFRILRSLTAAGATTTFMVPANTTEWTDSPLSPNTNYYYRVQAVRDLLSADPSAQISPRTLDSAPVPAAPSLLSTSEITARTVRLTWKDNSTNEDGFVVEQSTVPASIWTESGRVGYNVTTFVAGGLNLQQAYSFRVRAYNATGNSFSGIVTVTTSPAGGTWLLKGMRAGDIYYFAFSGPSRIERYDLAARAWLDPIAMQAPASALWVDESGIFAAEGRTVVRWNPDGSGRKEMITLAEDIFTLVTAGNVLAIRTGNYTTLDKITGATLGTFPYGPLEDGFSYDSARQRLFSRSYDNLRYMDLSPDGQLLRQGEGRVPGTAIPANLTYVFPAGGRVADNAGSVFSTEGPDYVTTLGTPFTDLAFHGVDVPVILRGDKLQSYTAGLQPAGSFTLGSANGVRLAVESTDALVFFPSGATDHGITVQTVPLTSVNTPTPGQPVNPEGLPYDVTDAFVDRDSQVNLYARSQMSLYRWSPETMAYTAKIPLAGAPGSISYTPSSHTLFTAYSSTRLLRKLPLGGATPLESLLTNLLVPPDSIASGPEFVYVSVGVPGIDNYWTYSPDGAILSSGNSPGFGNTWDPVRRRIYFLSTEFNGQRWNYRRIDNGGYVADTVNSAELVANFTIRQPVRVSPGGDLLVSADGRVFETENLTKTRAFGDGEPFNDIAWHGDHLLSLAPFGTAGTLVQRWSPEFTRESYVALAGTPVRVLPLDASRVVVITKHTTGQPRLYLLDASLNVTGDSINSAPLILQQPAFTRVDFRATAVLQVTAGGTPPLRYQWFKGTEAVPGGTSAVLELPNMGSLDAGSFTVTITNDNGSVTSDAVKVAAGPVPAPYFSSADLLVSSGKNIYEYTPAGTSVKTLAVPPAPGATTDNQFQGDVTMDRNGSVYVLNRGVVNNYLQFYVSTFDPAFNAWKHRRIPDVSRTMPDNLEADLTLAGEWLYYYGGRFNVRTGEIQPLPPGFDASQVAATPDGTIYGISFTGEFRHLDTNGWTWDPPVTLIVPDTVNGLALDGTSIFTGHRGPFIRSYGPGGNLLQSLQPTGQLGGVQDLSLSSAGALAAGHQENKVTLTSSSLAGAQTLVLPSFSNSGTFTAWAPALASNAPYFAETSAPDALEDQPWSWTPPLAHPDPDAVLSLAVIQIPPWVTFSEGKLSGTPRHADSGPWQLVLRGSDDKGHTVEQTIALNAVEVNDTPVAQNLALNRLEDAPPEDVDLTTLFSDEETAAGALSFTVISNTGNLVSAAIAGHTLRLAYLPDANGPGTVTVRTTDEGGLTADSIISLFATPVNDPPSFPAAIPAIPAGDAARDAVVNFAPFVTDPDAGDTLTWRIVSNTNPGIFKTLSFDSQGRLSLAYTPYVSGTAEVTVEVSDGEGTTARSTFQIVLPELPPPSLTLEDSLTLNRQTGLWEQRVTVKNNGARALGGFEISVTGLPEGTSLYNATDSTGGHLLTGYYQPLAPGESVSLMLEYYSPSRSTPLAPRLSAIPVLPRESTSQSPGDLAIDRMVMLEPGALLLEFNAVPDQLYLIQYSSDGLHWLDSFVRIRAAGTRVQWIDRGPPWTDRSPLEAPKRLYRVKKL